MKDIGKFMNIVENFIFDYFQDETVNEVINTKDEAIKIEKHLRSLLINTLINFEETIKEEK